jgi:hypothetical protein
MINLISELWPKALGAERRSGKEKPVCGFPPSFFFHAIRL